jgi:hypothetical protein
MPQVPPVANAAHSTAADLPPPLEKRLTHARKVTGRLTFAAFAGAAVEAELRCGETTILCLLDRDADLTAGRAVRLRARPEACLVLPEE